MRLSILRFAAGCIFLHVLAGCSSIGSTRVLLPATVRLSGYETLELNVVSPGSYEEGVQLESGIAGRLREKRLFESVRLSDGAESINADIALVVSITSLRRVSSGARVWFGAFAGRGHLEVHVRLLEGQSGNLIAEADIRGVTSSGSVFAGTTPQAVERVIEEVVEFIEINM